MERKLLYIGLGLIIVAVILFVVNIYMSGNLSTGFQNVLITNNLTVKSNGYSSVAINATDSSYLFVVALLSKPANLYLFNSSAFMAWKATVGSNNPVQGTSAAVGLEGKGTFYIFRNVMNVSIPQSLVSSNNTALYSANSSAIYPKGTYYFVVDNTNGSVSSQSQLSASVIYLPPITNSSMTTGPLSGLSSQIAQEAWLGVIFFIVLIAGIIVLVYGFFKKPKSGVPGQPPQQESPAKPARLDPDTDKQYVDRLYEGIEKRKKAKKRSRT